MKTKKLFEIEIQRRDVTPAQFLSYVRRSVDKKGGQGFRSDLSLSYFAAGEDLNFDYNDGTPSVNACEAERSVSKPYEMQTYVRNFDGSVYNEICEFDFDDEKTGHGYYYLLNTEAEEGAEDENTAETLRSVSTRCENRISRNNAKIDSINKELEEGGLSLLKWYREGKEAEIERLEVENERLRANIEECDLFVEKWEEAHKPTSEQRVAEITAIVEAGNTRSAWTRGVKAYALDMLEEMAFNAKHGYLDLDAFSNGKMLRDALLNGASDWSQYSWGGSALIYDPDIAERLCNPSELKKTRNGERKPNSREEWLDTQARALGQAARLITEANGQLPAIA